MNYQEENLQKYQLIQDNIIYILSTSLIGINLKISCFRYEGNNNPNNIYASIFTIEQLKKSDPIFEIANDCEDVQWIFEEVILAKSVGILESNGFLYVYFYMRVSGRKAKVILKLNCVQTPQMISPNINPNINNMNNVNNMNNLNNMNRINNMNNTNNLNNMNRINNMNNISNMNNLNNMNRINSMNNISNINSMNRMNSMNNINRINNMNNINSMNNINTMNNMTDYQKNQERLSKLQYDANQLIQEQNALRKQLSIFFGEEEDVKNNHERSRSTNQKNKYYNQLNDYNNNFSDANNNFNNNNMINFKPLQMNGEDGNDIYEVPPMNDNEQYQ